MPVNKNAMIRYLTLDKCFGNPCRKFFIDNLLEAVNSAIAESDPNTDGIKKRQLFDDIRFMESENGWSIPLGRYKDGRRFYYRYYFSYALHLEFYPSLSPKKKHEFFILART